MTEREMVEEWVKKNKPKRYTHGERPEGQDPEIVSPWGTKRKSKAEAQAAKDAERGTTAREEQFRPVWLGFT